MSVLQSTLDLVTRKPEAPFIYFILADERDHGAIRALLNAAKFVYTDPRDDYADIKNVGNIFYTFLNQEFSKPRNHPAFEFVFLIPASRSAIRTRRLTEMREIWKKDDQIRNQRRQQALDSIFPLDTSIPK